MVPAWYQRAETLAGRPLESDFAAHDGHAAGWSPCPRVPECRAIVPCLDMSFLDSTRLDTPAARTPFRTMQQELGKYKSDLIDSHGIPPEIARIYQEHAIRQIKRSFEEGTAFGRDFTLFYPH